MRRFLMSLAFLAAAGVASSASADTFYNLRAGVPDQGGGTAGVNVNTVQGTALGGYSYANQYTGAVGLPVGGERVRTVTADVITGYTQNPGGMLPIFNNLGGNDKIVAIFAGDGTISVGMGGLQTATFTSGRLWFFESPVSGPGNAFFDPINPSTWGFGGAPLAVFDLIAPMDIAPGNALANGNAFSASQVNNISLNSLAPQQAQGRFLFRDVNDPYILVTDPLLVPGVVAIQEGLWGTIEESLDQTPDPLSAGNLAILNQIAAAAGLGNLGGAGTAFATGLGSGLNTDFGPTGLPNAGATGDFQFNLGSSFVPGLIGRPEIEIPEPASMIVWGVGMGIAGLMGARYRRKKADA